VILSLLAAADLLLVNGRVHTFDPAHPESEAVLVRGERIVAVGTASALRAQAGADARVLDLGRRAVIPGLIDTHTFCSRPWPAAWPGTLDIGDPVVRSLANGRPWGAARGARPGPGSWEAAGRVEMASAATSARPISTVSAGTGARQCALPHGEQGAGIRLWRHPRRGGFIDCAGRASKLLKGLAWTRGISFITALPGTGFGPSAPSWEGRR
jgi:hypothetical protein